MLAAADMVIENRPVADIGTDHGFIPAFLLIEGRCPFAVMTDINKGPLERCAENMQSLGISPKLYDLRIGDGFAPLKAGEVSSAVIAGMGGELIQSMFENAPDDLAWLERAVLQPRTHSDDLRAFLTGSGYRICDYRLVRERGRICEVFAVEHCNAGEYKIDDGLVSRFLLEKGDPLLAEFVDRKIYSVNSVLLSLENANNSSSDRALWAALLQQFEDIRKNL